ncbi:hypothetical protein [Candidatus Fokinia crypta]|uniref:Uncharacterized protein n=1 Tax=Candidatus Fokinia crypta TaxID=1920990 RepID=A0ABZ0USC6_9RICK|nr:hypothetical protein [Candidatus Fokinia cryptica]WPX97934.1 hypothetical protein Fokcrypt_00458 [Candidatus Fokinia cryptica]
MKHRISSLTIPPLNESERNIRSWLHMYLYPAVNQTLSEIADLKKEVTALKEEVTALKEEKKLLP